MNISDVEQFPRGEVFRSSLCIVGSGPAGLTLTTELTNSHHEVLVLESGGRSREEPFSDALNEIEVSANRAHRWAPPGWPSLRTAALSIATPLRLASTISTLPAVPFPGSEPRQLDAEHRGTLDPSCGDFAPSTDRPLQ